MKILLLFLFISYPLFSLAQKQTFSPEEIRQDMAVLKRKFEKLHPGMYYYITKEKYNKIYDSLYNSVKQPLNYIETYHLLSALVTNVKDGHTSIRLDKKRFDRKKLKMVPFYLRKLDSKYYIALNLSRDSNIVRGSEILRINDESISNVIEKIKSFISTDNDNVLTKYYYATGGFPNYYFRQYGELDSIKITYRLPKSDTIFSKKLACLTTIETNKISDKRYKQFKRPNLALKIEDSLAHIATLDITEFIMTGKFLDYGNLKFKRVLRERFRQIKAKGIEHLIIDFRGNGGGYIPNISRVLKYISPIPFTMVDTLAFKKSAYFTIAKPFWILPPLILWMVFPKRNEEFMYRVNKRNNKQKPERQLSYRGKTYFITDPGCYSATNFTLNLAKDLGLSQAIIGQPIGGATWGSFAVTWQDFKLPNTKYVVHTPLYKITHRLPNQASKDYFLQPDYKVDRNYEELIKNNVSAIDFTLDMIRKSKAASMK